MFLKSLSTSDMFKLLQDRKDSAVAQGLSGILLSMESTVADSLENIKINFPSFTEHGFQHSIRIIDYIYCISSEALRNNLSDVELFSFIMSSLFHDIGMTLTDIPDKDQQRSNHHMYAKEPIKIYFRDYLKSIPESRRFYDCVSFVCEAHGRDISELYDDTTFRNEDTIQGQRLRYGLLAILLRIGDLMDLEEGRTNEFFMHINSYNHMNKISIEHHERHLEVKEYNYDSEFIRIIVKTKNRDRFQIWDEWLRYLDTEIMYANTHYLGRTKIKDKFHFSFPEVVFTIIPADNADFTIEEIRFQIDDKGILWDIITKSIYTNELDYIRELVQNAIDASLLKYYLNEEFPIKLKSPRSWQINDKITILYSEIRGELYICDNGIGMSEADIRNYLFKAADSGYKYRKVRDEFEFPSIAKFGIGFIACLTKVKKIIVISESNDHMKVKAEIVEKSNIAFIEKIKKDYKTGTYFGLTLKNKIYFKELITYLKDTIVYPSLGIQIFDLDNFVVLNNKINAIKINDIDLFNYEIIYSIINQKDIINEKRSDVIDPYIQDHKLLNEIASLRGKQVEDELIKDKINDMLKFVSSKSLIKNNIQELLLKNDIQLLSKNISVLRSEVDNKLKEYPEFDFEIGYRAISNIVDYDVLNVALDNNFNVISKNCDNKVKRCKGMGLLFIKTYINDSDIGIEWQAVNAFIYKDGEIEQNIIRINYDYEANNDDDDNLEYYNNVISLDHLKDVDYEMNLMYEEEINVDFYENILNNKEDTKNNKLYERYYDLLHLYKKDFYLLEGLDLDNLKMIDLVYNSKKPKKFFENFYDLFGESTEIKESKFYQDGILIHFNPQLLIPLGVGWSMCNLTADARFDLNVSRHEINMSRENIDLWIKKYGKIIQEKVVQRCTEVFNKTGLKFSINKIINDSGEDNYFENICRDNIKEILKSYSN